MHIPNSNLAGFPRSQVDTEVTEQCAICYEDLTMQAPRLLRSVICV